MPRATTAGLRKGRARRTPAPLNAGAHLDCAATLAPGARLGARAHLGVPVARDDADLERKHHREGRLPRPA
jgi:hypothetical protein